MFYNEIYSHNEFFQISIIDFSSVPYPIFKPIDKTERPIIISEENYQFKIQIKTNSDKINDHDSYGCKLFIDGKEVKGVKTFYKLGFFHGFKLGDGHYKEFLFCKPEYTEESKSKNNNDMNIDIDKATITILFYKTERRKVNNQERRPVTYEKHNIQKMPTNKKACMNSLQVNEGREFEITTTRREIYKQQTRFQTIKYENFIVYDDEIDKIKLRYSDYYSLLAQGYLSASNINHYRAIPYRNDKNYFLVKNIIFSIIEKESESSNSLNITRLIDSFKKYTCHSLELYYEGSTFYQMIRNKKELSDCFDIDIGNHTISIKSKIIKNINNINELEPEDEPQASKKVFKENELNQILNKFSLFMTKDKDLLKTEYILSKKELEIVMNNRKNIKQNRSLDDLLSYLDLLEDNGKSIEVVDLTP